MKIFFLIRSLGHGGAERQLIELASALDRTRFDITVATFYDGGDLRPLIDRADGVRVLSLGKRGRWDLLPFAWRLWREFRESRPDVVHGYMGVANELALCLGKLGGARVVWGLRMSHVDWSQHERLTALLDRIGASLSRFADLMIANSEAGRDAYAARGYSPDRIVIVPNGIDTDTFRPDPEARRRVRAEWIVAEEERVIGTVGRIDAQKDHLTFVRAAALIALRRPEVRFVVVGDGPEPRRQELERVARDAGLGAKLRWIRGSHEMTAINNAFDVATLTSAYGEGFPNVVGEAMACGVPTVSTAVGDAARIIAAPDQVVPAGDPSALANAWTRLLDLSDTERRAIGVAGRERIVSEFSVARLAQRTSELLVGLRQFP